MYKSNHFAIKFSALIIIRVDLLKLWPRTNEETQQLLNTIDKIIGHIEMRGNRRKTKRMWQIATCSNGI